MSEQWKPIERWPGYEVSDHGRLGSWLKSPNESTAPTSRRILTGGRDRAGYRRAVLCNPATKARKSLKLAHLVAEAFHGPRPSPGTVLRHLDGVNDNDAASNLAWGTQAQNMADKWRHGTQQAGERNPRASMTEATARAILADYRADRGTTRQIADRHGVSVHAAYNIGKRRSWKHLG